MKGIFHIHKELSSDGLEGILRGLPLDILHGDAPQFKPGKIEPEDLHYLVVLADDGEIEVIPVTDPILTQSVHYVRKTEDPERSDSGKLAFKDAGSEAVALQYLGKDLVLFYEYRTPNLE